MAKILGLVIALPAEAKAVIGKKHWRRQGRWLTHRHALPSGHTLLVIRSGIGPENALSAARWLVRQGVCTLGITGVSGGLRPGLKPGDLIVADQVCRHEDGPEDCFWPTAGEYADLLSQQLADSGRRVFRGPIATGATPVQNSAEKQALFSKSGCFAVDMESAAVACAAREAAVPFFALRAICDPVDRSLPADLVDILSHNGVLQPTVLLGKLLRRPLLALDLIRLRQDFVTALKALKSPWQASLEDTLAACLPEDEQTAAIFHTDADFFMKGGSAFPADPESALPAPAAENAPKNSEQSPISAPSRESEQRGRVNAPRKWPQ